MTNQFSRTARVLGEPALQTLSACRVAIFGLGGVGGYVAEALVRSGVGRFDLIDHDIVDITNLNRQIIATHRTVGRAKTEVMRERMTDINPEAEIVIHPCFFLPENADRFDFKKYDYVIDAVDTVTAKIELVLCAQAAGVPIISSMGTGNKVNPALLEVADIYRTSVCPLARVMRRELRKRGVERLKVVYSREEPIRAFHVASEKEDSLPQGGKTGEESSRVGREAAWKEDDLSGDKKMKKIPDRLPGSAAFVPAAAGLLIASEVVKDLISAKPLS